MMNTIPYFQTWGNIGGSVCGGCAFLAEYDSWIFVNSEQYTSTTIHRSDTNIVGLQHEQRRTCHTVEVASASRAPACAGPHGTGLRGMHTIAQRACAACPLCYGCPRACLRNYAFY
ncbi:hypothetical protein WA026_021058 [Henosepilachna vigintioctopunctata]|uniref:Uncharacterized protein n=1 Tax=Henosepilachna vigintioctopunctata TaxID=420089 RepID=A0AAW1UXQ7_9CUCU